MKFIEDIGLIENIMEWYKKRRMTKNVSNKRSSVL